MNICDKPIGVFDSGVGGITVLKELCALMPNEDYIYFGDSLNAPYGNRSDEEIEALIAERTQARKDKNWALADKIRDDLKARGIVLEDTPDGVKYKIEK